MNIFLEDFIQAEIFLSGRYFFREEIPFEKRFLSRRYFFRDDISFGKISFGPHIRQGRKWAEWGIVHPDFGKIEGTRQQWRATLLFVHHALGSYLCPFKGQLISKGLFVFFNSPKKRKKNFHPNFLSRLTDV